MNTPRRGFLGHLSATLLMLASTPALLRADGGSTRHVASDDPWLDGLTGRHRQFFDVASVAAGAPLARVRNFLDVYHDAYGQGDTDVNAVFGAYGPALALVLNDSAWSSFRLGTRFSINDPGTAAVAVRNPFAGTGDADASGPAGITVAALQRRGVRFLACRQSLARLSRDLAAESGRSSAEVNKALLASLLPGVMPVPAMIIACNRAQEAGLTYAYLG